MIVLKAIWEGMKWMGEAYYNWRKGNNKDLQTELETGGRLKTTLPLMIKSRQDL